MNLTAFVVINIISTIFCFVRTRHKTNYFFSGYLSAMSLGILASVIDPLPIKHAVDHIVLSQLIARFLSAISYRFSPYFLLLAGFALTGLVPHHKRKFLAFLLALPLIAEFIYGFIFPKESFLFVYPDYSRTFWFLGLWGFIYVLIANGLFCYTFFSEKDKKVKLQKLFVTILTLPTIFVTFQAYIVPMSGSHLFTGYTAELGVFTAIAASFFAARYGFLGIRLVIGKDFLESSLKSVTLGTSMLNHAIKNDLQVINSCVSVLQQNSCDERNKKTLKQISDCTEHLAQVVNRLDILTQEVVLYKENFDLEDIVERVIQCHLSIMTKAHIDIDRKYSPCPMVVGDPVHLQEVFANLLNNAVDSMANGGVITIEIFPHGRSVKLRITDSGLGIAKETLSRVMEPFFTTKRTSGNYGLGLSYCYKVMQKHKGSIEITSEVNKGTSVTLSFPTR